MEPCNLAFERLMNDDQGFDNVPRWKFVTNSDHFETMSEIHA